MSGTKFRLTCATDTGLVRQHNEDNFIINRNLSKNDWFVPSDPDQVLDMDELGTLTVIADGMGGMNAGEVASAIAIETIRDCFSDKEKLAEIILEKQSIESFMVEAVEKADSCIKNRAREDKSTSGMGTTVAIMWILDQKAFLCWCGDSRIYRYNKNDEDHKLIRLSKDHSYVQKLVDDGALDPQLAFDHPDKNIVTKCLGDGPVEMSVPDFKDYDIVVGDIFLLCSDGLTDMCRDEEICAIFDGYDGEGFLHLRNTLMGKALDEGGYDNITIALLEIVSLQKSVKLYREQTFVDDGKGVVEDWRKLLKIIAAAAVLILAAIVFVRSRLSVQKPEPQAVEDETSPAKVEFFRHPKMADDAENTESGESLTPVPADSSLTEKSEHGSKISAHLLDTAQKKEGEISKYVQQADSIK